MTTIILVKIIPPPEHVSLRRETVRLALAPADMKHEASCVVF